jgi:hypothetical protein
MTKIAGSGSESRSESGSISQRHGYVDPDPHQNVMDPQRWFGSWLNWFVEDGSKRKGRGL